MSESVHPDNIVSDTQIWHQKTNEFAWLVSLDGEKHLAQKCISRKSGEPDVWYLIPEFLESKKQ